MKSLIIRKRIIKTASELFYQNGYNLTGINEVIEKSGIAKATLYNHFKSKEELCVAYLKYQNTIFLTKMDAFLEKTETDANKILELFNFLMVYFKNKDFNGCCCVKTVSELPKDNIKIREEIKLQQNELIKLIKKVTNNTYISNTEKENRKLANQIYLLFNSALVESHLYQENWPIFVAKEMCEKIIK